MSVSFRSAVFHLCKKLSSNKESIRIREAIHNMSVVITKKGEDPGVLKRPSHGDLAYIASNQRLQFLGYLLADESVEDINKTAPFQATNLDESERSIIETGYLTLQLFLYKCTEELRRKYPKAYLLIDPYSLCRKPYLKTDASSFIDVKDFQECIDAFCSGKVYKKLIENDALQVLESMDENSVNQLCAVQKKQFLEDYADTTKETEDFMRRIHSNAEISLPDLLFAYSTYCYALRRSLSIALQMIFEAILGRTMTVMNNDNIISIVDRRNDFVYERYIVLIQDVLFGIKGGDVGSIVLLCCNPSDNYHIKAFGVIYALTVSFKSEFGESSKVTMITVDEELNEIFHYTDAIMSAKIGKTPVKYHNE